MKKKANSFRLVFFLAAAVLHLGLLFLVVFKMEEPPTEEEISVPVMKLVDVREAPPPPPPRPEKPPEPNQNTVEAVAETMVETEEVPEEQVPAAAPPQEITAVSSGEDYLPMHKISELPKFSEEAIRRALVYPPIALRSGLEGIVYLELFVDRQGEIRRITVLRENPAGRGFAEAAVKAFQGIRAASPALANGVAVAVRYRYPVRFTIR
jgi:protein TonB